MKNQTVTEFIISNIGGHMSITNELRAWAEKNECKSYCKLLTDIADRIDAEHEDQLLGECNIAYNAGYDEGFASADDWLGQHEDAMAEHGWVKLPVDADGEYIRIGDVMEWCDSGETLTVEGIGSDVLFYIDGENAEWTAARNKRHHHAPTVEDVLREFGDWYAHTKGGCDEDGIIAEYAAKLKLISNK